MLRYIVIRLGQSVFVILLVSLLVFVLSHVSGDPILLLIPPDATEEEVANMRRDYGFDRPLIIQYYEFIAHAAKGDFGKSIHWGGRPPLKVVTERFPATAQLALAGLALAWAFAIPMGMLAAVKHGSPVDMFARAFAVFAQSVPGFWLGIMLILFFAVNLRILPPSGRGDWNQIILPAITLAHFPTAALLRLTRSSMLEVMDSDYIRMARAKGVPELMVIVKHAFRNASIPVVTIMGLQLGEVLRGAVLVEIVFGWPGIGKLAVDAIHARDFPVLQTSVLFMVVIVIVTNLVVDMLYSYLDPRIRYR